MSFSFRAVWATAGCGLLMATCGFAPPISQSLTADVIVTAAPAYDSLAAFRGGERFPKGAQLLLIHDGVARPLVSGFAATADASISFEGDRVLFAGKKTVDSPWQIWELTLADRQLRQVTTSTSDAIRPIYLPGWRLVYAQRTPLGFQLQSARLADSKALDQIEGPAAKSILPLTYITASAIPTDVLSDGRILFESGFPLGEGQTPELFLVYSDGSGVESYRCDHPAKTTDVRWGGRQLKSGDVVFTHGNSLARFTAAQAHEERVTAPRAEYAGAIAETASGEWLVSARNTSAASYALKLWKPGSPAMREILARNGENIIEPAIVAPHDRPRRHPSALHDWDYANLLALDVRVSRDGQIKGAPTTVRLETEDASGNVISVGAAPVEPDGSFFVKAPADRAIRFVLLDAQGTILRQEHGWFWIRRGEQRYCVGCHAGPEHAPDNRVPQVLSRSTTPADLTGASQQLQKGGN